jgi:hypothetical protein
MKLKNKKKIACDVLIIGAGIFGVTIAIELRKLNINCVIVDKGNQIFSGASGNNTGRVHLGYHYPRDIETAEQSFNSARHFTEKYYKSIIKTINNNYLITNDYSNNIDQDKFENFMANMKLPNKSMTNADILGTGVSVKRIIAGYKTQENITDLGILSEILQDEIENSNIPIYFNQEIDNLIEQNDGISAESDELNFLANRVIICTYMQKVGNYSIDVNFIFENTIVPIIKLDSPPIGNTLIDGPFCSILPFSSVKGTFSLYSVPFSRYTIENNISEQIDLVKNHVASYFPKIATGSIQFSLKSRRAIEIQTNNSAKRISKIIKSRESDNIIFIQSGKIDHTTFIADEVIRYFQFR